MSEHLKIDYLEFQAADLDAVKRFYGDVFGWEFIDYGPDYVSFANAGIDGGIRRSAEVARTKNGSVLIVFYSAELEKTQQRVEDAGGEIIEPIFSFPGGRRFHFSDPHGNECAVWSDG